MRLPAVFTAAALLCAALPAQANNTADLKNAIDGCYATVGDSGQATFDYMSQNFGWDGDADTEAGVGYIYAPGTENTSILVALDGSFCRVDTQVIDSATASEHLRAYLEAAGSEIEYNKTEEGCTSFGLGSGYDVTITGGGQDPMCGSETDASLVFTYTH
jgi:hypothetical protein